MQPVDAQAQLGATEGVRQGVEHEGGVRLVAAELAQLLHEGCPRVRRLPLGGQHRAGRGGPIATPPMPLVIAGVVQDADYHREHVEPFLDGVRVTYVGPVGSTERDRLLGGARALRHLIEVDGPFGLSVVEAMATGTPVITRARGSMPEIVRQGVTGFLVTGLDGAVEAVHAAAHLDRGACRADAIARFSAERMVGDYEALFASVIHGRPPTGSTVEGAQE